MTLLEIENPLDVEPTIRLAQKLKSELKLLPHAEVFCPPVKKTDTEKTLDDFITYQLEGALSAVWDAFSEEKNDNVNNENNTVDQPPAARAPVRNLATAVALMLTYFTCEGLVLIIWNNPDNCGSEKNNIVEQSNNVFAAKDLGAHIRRAVFIFANGIIYNMKLLRRIIGSIAFSEVCSQKHHSHPIIQKIMDAETLIIKPRQCWNCQSMQFLRFYFHPRNHRPAGKTRGPRSEVTENDLCDIESYVTTCLNCGCAISTFEDHPCTSIYDDKGTDNASTIMQTITQRIKADPIPPCEQERIILKLPIKLLKRKCTKVHVNDLKPLMAATGAFICIIIMSLCYKIYRMV